MIRSTPREPQFWKALVIVALFIFPACWIASTIVHWPSYVWFAITLMTWVGFAAAIHKRVKRDTGAQWQSNFAEFDRATNMPPDIRIGRK